jgi:hypothetical protein
MGTAIKISKEIEDEAKMSAKVSGEIYSWS